MTLDLLTTLRQQNPIVLTLANFVTVQDVANGLNALGASPIMSAEVDEAEAMVTIAGAVCLNLGTLTKLQLAQMRAVGDAANQQHKPVIFDPVAVGAVPYRLAAAQTLLQTVHADIIRGNAGEIAALAAWDWQAKGIDAGTGSGDLVAMAQACAQKYHCVVVLSGATDIVTDGQQVIRVHNGTELFQLHVGSGDLLSSLVAAFAAVQPQDLMAAAATAATVLAGTGELVADQLTASRPGTFAMLLIDKLHLVTTAELSKIAIVD